MTDLAAVAGRILSRAGDHEDVEVFAARSTTTEVRVHGGAVEALTVAESQGIGVRVVSGQQTGFAHAGSLDDSIIETLIGDARDNARYTEPDERAGLAVLDGVEPPDLVTHHPEFESIAIDDKIELALGLEAAVGAADHRVQGVRTAVYSDVSSERAIASTHGIRARTRATRASLATNAMIEDRDGATRTGAATEAARNPADLDAERVAGLAVERGIRLLGAAPPRPARVSVLLEPRFVATLLGVVANMLSGERVHKGRTPFAARMGEGIAAPVIDLVDDPTDPDSLGSTSFDGEGLATRPVRLIDRGVLESFLHDTGSARRSQAVSTGSAVRGARSTPRPGHRALHLSPGSGDLDSLLVGIEDGLWVHSLQGLHSGVNPVSGDLSVGVEGVRIRKGEPAEPLREATLAGAIPRLLTDVVAVGADIERLPGGAYVPSVVISGLALSGARSP